MARPARPGAWHRALAWQNLVDRARATHQQNPTLVPDPERHPEVVLPLILKTSDIRGLFPHWMWVKKQLPLGTIPGGQVRAGGHWFCARDIFVAWLKGEEDDDGPAD